MEAIFLFSFVLFLDNFDQSRYPMIGPHGICLIINNISFQPPVSRDGAFVDVRRILALFQHLDSDVHVKQDLTVDDITSTAGEFATKDHSQLSRICFLHSLTWWKQWRHFWCERRDHKCFRINVFLQVSRVSNTPKQTKALFLPGLERASTEP